ncbi:hypothetical protein ARSEF1564_002450 [Beauveria bassiana]
MFHVFTSSWGSKALKSGWYSAAASPTAALVTGKHAFKYSVLFNTCQLDSHTDVRKPSEHVYPTMSRSHSCPCTNQLLSSKDGRAAAIQE